MNATVLSVAGAILVCLLNNWFMDKRHREEAVDNLTVFKTEVSAKIETLTKSVEKHNNVIERVYALETKADVFEEKMKVANHRIDDLEELKHE
jgi:hypothetical protein